VRVATKPAFKATGDDDDDDEEDASGDVSTDGGAGVGGGGSWHPEGKDTARLKSTCAGNRPPASE